MATKEKENEALCKEPLSNNPDIPVSYVHQFSLHATTRPVYVHRVSYVTTLKATASYSSKAPLIAYDLKPRSYTKQAVSEFVVWYTQRKHMTYAKKVTEDRIKGWGRPENNLRLSPSDVLVCYYVIFNDLFFAALLTAQRGGFACKIQLIERGSEEETKFGLQNALGKCDVQFNPATNLCVCTIYIVNRLGDRSLQSRNEAYQNMLGTLAHEMLHAMFFRCVLLEEGHEKIPSHCKAFQDAAYAIEQATSTSCGFEWLQLNLDLGGRWCLASDIVLEGYERPEEQEMRAMPFSLTEFEEDINQLRRLKEGKELIPKSA